jgi:cell volume regulation protein A
VFLLRIKPGSFIDGRTVRDLPRDAWVSFVVRDGQLVGISEDTVLHSGDEVLVLADPDLRDELVTTFEGRLKYGI